MSIPESNPLQWLQEPAGVFASRLAHYIEDISWGSDPKMISLPMNHVRFLYNCVNASFKNDVESHRNVFVEGCRAALKMGVDREKVLAVLGISPNDGFSWKRNLFLLDDVIDLLIDDNLFTKREQRENLETFMVRFIPVFFSSYYSRGNDVTSPEEWTVDAVKQMEQNGNLHVFPANHPGIWRWMIEPDNIYGQKFHDIVQKCSISQAFISFIHKSLGDDKLFLSSWLCKNHMCNDDVKMYWLMKSMHYSYHQGIEDVAKLIKSDGFVPMQTFDMPESVLRDVLSVPSMYWDVLGDEAASQQLIEDQRLTVMENYTDQGFRNGEIVYPYSFFKKYVNDKFELHEDLVELNDFLQFVGDHARLPYGLKKLLEYREDFQGVFPAITSRLVKMELEDNLQKQTKDKNFVFRPRKI